MKAIVFDFNGTMFLDADKHRVVWREFLEERLGLQRGGYPPEHIQVLIRHGCAVGKLELSQ